MMSGGLGGGLDKYGGGGGGGAGGGGGGGMGSLDPIGVFLRLFGLSKSPNAQRWRHMLARMTWFVVYGTLCSAAIWSHLTAAPSETLLEVHET